ncbi:RHS repeat-associated core domain-containing protein [Paludibaculum fermentans]|uniref:RHS repeat-associated core domain-containing protein n=1 Tax=Paludibaculum fermentans TaxID=1473598 RepID=A0A7S7SPB6_PALFE|nr:RHS repeat-associated core domain-containing protein [Paludibaculum fermentans]QOY91733.1 hypothetical protein IRI77_17860 [Paludibaculum fermentans]
MNESNPAGGADLVTTYTYNLFNQPLTVTMTRGTTTQTRTFTYNTPFLLTSVAEPETGTATYTYWTDGQIRTKTDAKGNVTTYVRDGYGRPSTIYRKPAGATVDDPTQTTTYGYDTGVNAQGRLSSVVVGAATETYEYSVGGLVTRKGVAFPNNDAPLEAVYTYDTLGRMTSMKYPDVYNGNGAVAEVGRTLGYQYVDPMGPQKLTDSTYASPGWRVTAQRNSAGQLTQMVVYQANGTSETETFTYNSLGQLTQASGRGSNIEYRYSATGNDGRITSRKDNISGDEVSYTYDQLGRLIAAATTGPEWGLTWAYDGFGNRLRQEVTKGGRAAVYSVDPATNRLNGGGATYDPNGSIESFGTGAGTAAYDVDNRMVSMSLDANNVERYAYSAANQRIQVTRSNGTVETFFYGLAGELLGVYQRGTKANGHKYFSSASIRVWFAGRLISSGANSVVTDRLGSVVKDGSEALRYYPYGDQNPGSTTENREKFATYTRDGFSGLDYAQNRYYSPQFGRFTTADPFSDSADYSRPQGMNRYNYVESDPANGVDPTGLLAAPLAEPPPGWPTIKWYAYLERITTTILAQCTVSTTLVTINQHCKDLFNSTLIPASGPGPQQTLYNALENSTKATWFYEAEGPEGCLTLAEATGLASAGSMTVHDWAIRSYQAGDIAITMNYRKSTDDPFESIPHVVLFSGYFELSTVARGLVLLYELLHVVHGTHDQIISALQIPDSYIKDTGPSIGITN